MICLNTWPHRRILLRSALQFAVPITAESISLKFARTTERSKPQSQIAVPAETESHLVDPKSVLESLTLDDDAAGNPQPSSSSRRGTSGAKAEDLLLSIKLREEQYVSTDRSSEMDRSCRI